MHIKLGLIIMTTLLTVLPALGQSIDISDPSSSGLETAVDLFINEGIVDGGMLSLAYELFGDSHCMSDYIGERQGRVCVFPYPEYILEGRHFLAVSMEGFITSHDAIVVLRNGELFDFAYDLEQDEWPILVTTALTEGNYEVILFVSDFAILYDAIVYMDGRGISQIAFTFSI